MAAKKGAESNLTKGSGDAGQTEVQAQVDEENEQGFVGTKVDPTPNEHYTVAGVLAGKPTPENNAEQAAKARAEAGA